MRVPQAISKIIDRIDVITSKFDDTHRMARNIRWRVACFCLKAIRCFWLTVVAFSVELTICYVVYSCNTQHPLRSATTFRSDFLQPTTHQMGLHALTATNAIHELIIFIS